jgi:AraC family transcriptional regulator
MQTLAKLAPPVVQNKPAMNFAGLSEIQPMENNRIPQQWQKFGPHIGRIPGQVGSKCYGLCYADCDASGKTLEYIAAVEVSGDAPPPAGLIRRSVPAHQYLVFTHTGHVSTVKDSYAHIWGEAIPASGHQPAGDPTCIEMYDERFDPQTGNGGFEIWVPVK